MSDEQPERACRVTMAIGGITPDNVSAQIVEGALAGVPGVLLAYVNSSTEMAYVAYDPTYCATADLVAAVERVGLRADAPVRR